MTHGGKRAGSGRKPKHQEQQIIERLAPLEEEAIAMLKHCLEYRKPFALKLFFNYFYGMPKQQQEVQVMPFKGFDIKEDFGHFIKFKNEE